MRAKPIAKAPASSGKTAVQAAVKPIAKPVTPAPKKPEPTKMVSKPIAPAPKPKTSDAGEHITKQFATPATKHIEKMPIKEIKPVATPEEPQKTRYSDKELEEFDRLIDQKLIVAREQLEFYLKQLEDMAENPDNKIKGLDDGLSSLESERVSSMASRQQKLIQHLENAKIRIKNKVYGICRETGKLISKERLRAVPHATLSIEAKQAQN